MNILLKALLMLTLAFTTVDCDPIRREFYGCEWDAFDELKCKSSFKNTVTTNNEKYKINYMDFQEQKMSEFPDNQLNNLEITHLLLAKNKLTQVRKAMFTGAQIQQISFAKNMIVSIEEDSFVSQDKLTSLWFEHNKLGEMSTDSLSKVLSPLLKLKVLQLKHNDLKAIPDISHLVKLTDLQLENNMITDLMHTDPDKLLLPDNLVTLTLNNNQISVIDPRVFNNLRKLKYLNLNSNSITSINEDTFKGLPQLKSLGLSKNLIKIVPAGVFSSNLQLVRLDLSSQYTLLETIANYAFERIKPKDSQVVIPKMEVLDLSNNKLEQLPKRMFCSRDEKNSYLAIDEVLLGANAITHINPCIMLQISKGSKSKLPVVSFHFDNVMQIMKANLECDCNVTNTAKLVEYRGFCVTGGAQYSLKQFICESGNNEKEITRMCDLQEYNCEIEESIASVPSSVEVNPGADIIFTEPIENFNGKTVEPHIINPQNTHTSSNNQNLNTNPNKDRSNKVTNKPSQIAANAGQNLKFSAASVIVLIATSVFVRF